MRFPDVVQCQFLAGGFQQGFKVGFFLIQPALQTAQADMQGFCNVFLDWRRI